jgi:hypothetical protein
MRIDATSRPIVISGAGASSAPIPEKMQVIAASATTPAARSTIAALVAAIRPTRRPYATRRYASPPAEDGSTWLSVTEIDSQRSESR